MVAAPELQDSETPLSRNIEVIRFWERSDSCDGLFDQRFEARDVKLPVLIEGLFEVPNDRVLSKLRLHRPKLGIHDFVSPLRHNFWVRTEFRKREERFVAFDDERRIRDEFRNFLNTFFVNRVDNNTVDQSSQRRLLFGR
jgi:hypothetical protein